MISFRYHIVSIVAIFLAFALGIAVGTAALNGAVTDNLRDQVNRLGDQRDSLRTDASTLNKKVADQDGFATLYGDQVISGSLSGKTVAVIQAPGASRDAVDGVVARVAAAGGRVTGQIELTSDYLDPARAVDIRALATGPAHPVGLQLPPTDDAGALGGSLLAYVLVSTPTTGDVNQVLAGFATLQMVKVKGDTVTPADLAIIVTGGTSDSKSAPAMLVALASALDNQGDGVVIAGDTASAGEGGVIAAVRNDASASRSVSTVDDADTAIGRLTVILALAEQNSDGAGQYGTAAGADAIAPEPK
ncbi:MAG: uncharacterized protein JWN20_891 [Jatrophihabitantaceae bacterium]|nr:uncharacterized protein [Jatrophihabitantaceae bacterium]